MNTKTEKEKDLKNQEENHPESELGSKTAKASVRIHTDKEDAVNHLASFQKEMMRLMANQGYNLKHFKVEQKTINVQSMVLPIIDSDQLTKVNLVQ